VPLRLAQAIFLLPVVGAPLILAARLHKPLFRFITNEDSVLEWPEFVGFAAASLLALVCAWRLWRSGRSLLALAYLVFAIGAFFVAGEEIAWGQRIIGWGTPETFERINEQKETTLHNINSVQRLTNLSYLLVGVYGSVGAWIVRLRLRGRRRDVVDLLVPPLFLTAAFFVMFGYKFLRFAFFRESGFTVTRLGEWPEFCLALGLSVFALIVMRRLGARETVEVQPAGRREVAT
jgi:hypothetical protein